MTHKNIFKKLVESPDLPQLPQVMLKLIKACNAEKTSIEELTRIIAADPSLTSRLVQIAGSPYMNLPKAVDSIQQAVVYLGIDTIRNLAISTCAMRVFNLTKIVPEFDITKFWYHSYKCGVIARKIAEENHYSNPDEFFLAGLLHDIGRLVLLQNFPDDYKLILKAADNETQMIAGEIKKFNTDTPQVSAWLFGQWNLNPLISDAVLFINESIEQIDEALPHVKIVFISNFLAEPESQNNISEIIGLTDIPASRLETLAIEAQKEVCEMAQNLGIKIDEKQDPVYEQTLTSKVKDLSVFYGTLQNLLQARDIDSILDVVQNGFKIIFNIPRIFYFLLDEKKNILTGFCSDSDKSHKIIKSIALPLKNKSSLLIKCIKEQAVSQSLKIKPGQKLALSDTQIIRLLETKGLYCIPIYSQSGKRSMGAGVMVLGVNEKQAKTLEENKGLVTLFSKQTGICIQSIRFQNDYAMDIHDKKMEAYSTLTDKVIHEINNPVSIVKNYIETLKLKLPDKHPVQDDLSVISQEMNRVAGLLDKLKSFSQPEIDGFEPVDVNKLCTSILEILKKSILLPKQISTSTRMDPEIPMIKTDPNGLKQIFINLIKNAAEALDTGGKIKITTRFLSGSAKILIDEKRREPGNIEIAISDNGPGISETVKQTLFEPYTTTKIGGRNCGLGLSIVHSIVKALNGKIVCNTNADRGTRFVITLPVISSKQ